MDNNNPQQPAPTTEPEPVPTVPEKSGGKKMGLWLIVGIVVILMIGGAYWYLNKQAAPTATPVPATQNSPTPTSENLDQDLNSIDVSSSDSADFNSVDHDLKNL